MLVAYGSTDSAKIDLKAWWAEQPTAVKATLGLSAAALAGMLLFAITRKPSRALTPNKRGKRKSSKMGRKCTPNRAVKRPRISCQAAPSVPSCRCTPPKRYRKTGATRAKHYAFPECFMYPVHGPQYVRTSASRFGRFSQDIPTQFRGKVKARIRKAKKKFGIGEFKVR